jgi:hypothetical protein
MQVSILKPHIEKIYGSLLEGHTYYLHYMKVKPGGILLVLLTTLLKRGLPYGPT